MNVASVLEGLITFSHASSQISIEPLGVQASKLYASDYVAIEAASFK